MTVELTTDRTVEPGTAETLDALAGLWRRLVPPGGLSMTAASTLAQLTRSGPLRLTALAEREAVTQPAMTGLIGRLAKAGLIAREPDPADGRAVLVTITPKGRDLIAARRAERAAALGGLLDQLDAGQRAQIEGAIPALRCLVERAGPELTTSKERP